MKPIENTLRSILCNRILVLDGAMGAMVQTQGLSESDFRGGKFKEHGCELKGNNDILCLSQPDLIRSIHASYYKAGADIVTTNSFSATSISQSEYQTEHLSFEINKRAAQLANREAALWSSKTPDKPRWVAGSIGPTNRTLSISPDVENPGYRALTFDQLAEAYTTQVRGLIEGGVDLFLLETIFDTLNAKAALFAIQKVFQDKKLHRPVMISVSISDKSGRTLSGQTIEAFWYSIEHTRPLSIGLNCGLGAEQMRPFLKELSDLASTYVSCHPNAGLPNAFGGYDEKPETTSQLLREFAQDGLVNVVGGCCGTTPDHIRAISEAVQGLPPRPMPVPSRQPRFSGIDPLRLGQDAGFQMIGERTNVAGSRKFLRLIKNQDYSAAVEVAVEQVRGGANILDVNMDEALLDSENSMTTFLNYLASEPEVARIPIMIDSSRFSVIEAGLKCVQGKSIVNSISLKDGEKEFIDQAEKIHAFGAAVVVMAFDEKGQGDTVQRKTEIGQRAYRILIEKVGMNPWDIIFDPAVLTVATGMEEHSDYAMAFIEATRRFKQLCPSALVSGGISNLSFSFRGNDRIRETMHAAFLYHAIQAGLDMGIVNAGQLTLYQDIPKDLLGLVENVLFNRHTDATERLVEFAEKVRGKGKKRQIDLEWRRLSIEDRLHHALVNGIHDYIIEDITEACSSYPIPLDIIEGPLMDGMKTIGELFGAGKMFLPQVVKSARVMKKAVSHLMPLIQANKGQESVNLKSRGKILLATVKGDVHDIGKNIVGVVLGCNNYQVIDLGVRIPSSTLLAAAAEHGVDMIGLSGLITPSLDEMAVVASEMQKQKMDIPLLIGGATTSRQHTAVKLAPCYEGIVVHVKDASRVSSVISQLLDTNKRAEFIESTKHDQTLLRQKHHETKRPLESYERSNQLAFRTDWQTQSIAKPTFFGPQILRDYPLDEIAPYIDWTFFFLAWDLKGRYPDILKHPVYGKSASDLYSNATQLLEQIIANKLLTANATYGFWPANADGNDIVLWDDETREREAMRLNMLRQQYSKVDSTPHLCLADFVAPIESGIPDCIGMFALTAGVGIDEVVAEFGKQKDDYSVIMAKALADRLAEAFAELLHKRVRSEWNYGKNENLGINDLFAGRYRGIRPAYGYPACPDHSEKAKLFELLSTSDLGISLTEHFAISPAASVSGIYLAHPESRYFTVGKIDRHQLEDYAHRKGMNISEAKKWLAPNLA